MFDQTTNNKHLPTASPNTGSHRNSGSLISRSSGIENVPSLNGSNMGTTSELVGEKSSTINSPTNSNPYAKRFPFASSPKAAHPIPNRQALSQALPSVNPSSTGASLRGSFGTTPSSPLASRGILTTNYNSREGSPTGNTSSNQAVSYASRPLLKELSPPSMAHHSQMYTIRSPNRSQGTSAPQNSSAGPSSVDEKVHPVVGSSRGAGGRIVPLPLGFDNSNAPLLTAQLRNGSGIGALQSVTGSRKNLLDTAPPSPFKMLSNSLNSGQSSLNKIPSLNKLTGGMGTVAGSNDGGSSDGITNTAPGSCYTQRTGHHLAGANANIMSSATESMASSGFEVAVPVSQPHPHPNPHPQPTSSFVGNIYAALAGATSQLPPTCVYSDDHLPSSPTVGSPHVPSPPLRLHGSAHPSWRLQHAQYIRSHQITPNVLGMLPTNATSDSRLNGDERMLATTDTSVGINPSPFQHPIVLQTQQQQQQQPPQLDMYSVAAGQNPLSSASASSSLKPNTKHSRTGSSSPGNFALTGKRVGSAYSSLRSRSQSRGPYCLPVPSTRRTSSALLAPSHRSALSPSAAPLGGFASTTLSNLSHSPMPTPAVLPVDDDELSMLNTRPAYSASLAAHTEASNVSGSVSRTTSCGTNTTNGTSSVSPRIAVDGSSVSMSDLSGSPSSAVASPAQRKGMIPRHLMAAGSGSTFLGPEVQRTNTTTSQGSYRGIGMDIYQTSMDDLMALGQTIMASVSVTTSGSNIKGLVMPPPNLSAVATSQSEEYGSAAADTVRLSNSGAPTPTADGNGSASLSAKGRSTSAGKRLGGNVVFIEHEEEGNHIEGPAGERSRTNSTMTSGCVTVQSSLTGGQHSSSPHSQGSNGNLVNHMSGRKRSTGELDSHNLGANAGAAGRTVSDMSMLGMADPSRLVRNDARKSIITKNAERTVDDADMESVNNYIFDRVISATKASTVYVAVDLIGECKYAIKVLPRMALTNGWDSAAVSRVNSRTTPVPTEPMSARRATIDRPEYDSISTKKLPSIATTPREGNVEVHTSPFGGMPLGAAGYASASSTSNAVTASATYKPTFVGSDLIHLDPILEKRCREVAIMKEANCIYIVRLHEAILDPKHRYMYLVMEYVDGGRILKPSTDEAFQYERIPQLKAVRYAKQLITALTFLHIKGIVHRDIKPENVLLDELKDHVKLTDFGVSETIKDGTLVHPGLSVAGTPMFLAPEAFGTEPFDAMPLDVWAFGVTVYALGTGNLPFEGGSKEEVGNNVKTTTPVYPPGMHPALITMCRRCLVKDPKKRITMGQLWYACLLESDRDAVGKQIPPESRAFFEIKRAPKVVPMITNRGSLAAMNAQPPIKKRSKRGTSRKETGIPSISDAVAKAARELAEANSIAGAITIPQHVVLSTPDVAIPEILQSGAHHFNNEVSGADIAMDVLSEDSLDNEDKKTRAPAAALVSLSSEEGLEAPRRSSTAMKSAEEPLEVITAVEMKVGLSSPGQTEVTILSRSGNHTVDSVMVLSPPEEQASPDASPKFFRHTTFGDMDFAIPLALRDETSPSHGGDDRRESMWSEADFSTQLDENGSFNFTSTSDMAAALAAEWAASTTELTSGLEGFVNGSFAFTSVVDLLKYNEPKVQVTDANLAEAFVFAQPSTSQASQTPESRGNQSQAQHMETPSISRVPSGLVGHKMVSTTDTTPRTRNSSIPPVEFGSAMPEYEHNAHPIQGADIPLTPHSSRQMVLPALQSPGPSLFTPRLNATHTVPPSAMASPESIPNRNGPAVPYPPVPYGMKLDSPTEPVAPPIGIRLMGGRL